MNRLLVPVLLAAALAAVLALELFGVSGDDPDMSPPATDARLPPSPGAAPTAAVGRPSDPVTPILQRPLFSPDRRPPPGAGTVAASTQPLPRVAGVLVSSGGRRAIFAPAGGGKPVVVAEGERIGDAVVRRIEAGRVTVLTPDGERVLVPSFDPAPPRPAAPPVPAATPPGPPLGLQFPPPGGLPGLTGFQNLPGVSGTPQAPGARR